MEEKSKVKMEESPSNPIKMGTFLESRVLFALFVIMHVVWISLGVAKLVIGAMHVDDCDREEMIPIWLIVDAFIPIVFMVSFVPYYTNTSKDMKKYGAIGMVVGIVLYVGWSICGGIFIYPNWNNKNGDCDRVVAQCSFVAITINWSVIGVWCQLVGRLLYWTFSTKGQQCQSTTNSPY